MDVYNFCENQKESPLVLDWIQELWRSGDAARKQSIVDYLSAVLNLFWFSGFIIYVHFRVRQTEKDYGILQVSLVLNEMLKIFGSGPYNFQQIMNVQPSTSTCLKPACHLQKRETCSTVATSWTVHAHEFPRLLLAAFIYASKILSVLLCLDRIQALHNPLQYRHEQSRPGAQMRRFVRVNLVAYGCGAFVPFVHALIPYYGAHYSDFASRGREADRPKICLASTQMSRWSHQSPGSRQNGLIRTNHTLEHSWPLFDNNTVVDKNTSFFVDPFLCWRPNECCQVEADHGATVVSIGILVVIDLSLAILSVALAHLFKAKVFNQQNQVTIQPRGNGNGSRCPPPLHQHCPSQQQQVTSTTVATACTPPMSNHTTTTINLTSTRPPGIERQREERNILQEERNHERLLTGMILFDAVASITFSVFVGIHQLSFQSSASTRSFRSITFSLARAVHASQLLSSILLPLFLSSVLQKKYLGILCLGPSDQHKHCWCNKKGIIIDRLLPKSPRNRVILTVFATVGVQIFLNVIGRTLLL